jgi:hypothetical protein
MSTFIRDPREHFRNIKAIFEASPSNNMPLQPPSRPNSSVSFRHSRPVTPTDERPPAAILDPVSSEERELGDTIEGVVFDVPQPPYHQPVQPVEEPSSPKVQEQTTPVCPSASTRPSWVGRPAAISPYMPTTMPQEVKITFSSPSLQPPVYIISSLSEPQWEVLEMDASAGENGQLHFSKVFHAQPGEYQYKFRLGPGDWWVCDESGEIVDDGLGNRNNLVVIKEKAPAAALTRAKPPKPVVPEVQDREIHHQPPLFPHERHPNTEESLEPPPEDIPVHYQTPRQDTIALPGHGDVSDDEDDEEPSHHFSSPLFRHETGLGPFQASSGNCTPGADEDEEPILAPHEPAPLFKHEEMPLATHHDAQLPPATIFSTLPLPHQHDAVPAEADPHDPSLSPFPTSHEGILGSIRRASIHLVEDETTEDSIASPGTSPLAKSVRRGSSTPPTLPSLEEQEEEEHSDLSASKLPDFSALKEAIVHPTAPATPPKTPVEEHPHHSEHHHRVLAELDMAEEAKHDVKHHDEPVGDESGTTESASAEPANEAEAEAPKVADDEAPLPIHEELKKNVTQAVAKSGGWLSSLMGMVLTTAVAAFAVWFAWKVIGADAVKDGGAVMHG